MQAIILAAGYGRRLSGYTREPKCLLGIENKPIIQRQLEMLADFGIRDVVVVTGYAADKVEGFLNTINSVNIVTVHNPFYKMTNVLGSFWFGMKELRGSFMYLEGDTIFERAVMQDVINSEADCALSIKYGDVDDEAMKVVISGNKLLEISKEIPPERADGEFIGLAKFSDRARRVLTEITDRRIRDQYFNDYFEYALSRSIEERRELTFDFIRIDGRYCCEIDFQVDYEFALKHFKE